MLITKPIAFLVNESMTLGSKNIVKPQKNNQNFIKNYKNSESKPKKHVRFLQNESFVH